MWRACNLAKEGKIPAADFVEAVWQHFKSRPPLGEVAVKEGYLSMADLFTTLSRQADYGGPFGETAVDCGFITRDELASLLLKQEELASPVERFLPTETDGESTFELDDEDGGASLLAASTVVTLGGAF